MESLFALIGTAIVLFGSTNMGDVFVLIGSSREFGSHHRRAESRESATLTPPVKQEAYSGRKL